VVPLVLGGAAGGRARPQAGVGSQRGSLRPSGHVVGSPDGDGLTTTEGVPGVKSGARPLPNSKRGPLKPDTLPETGGQ